MGNRGNDGIVPIETRKESRKMKKVSVENLIIEITRKCNMSCRMCLRGDNEDVNIKTEYIDTLLKRISSIGTIQFTGGEPSENVDAMNYALYRCKQLEIPVYAFYVVTNGKEVTDRFLGVMDDWHAYCLTCVFTEQGWRQTCIGGEDAIDMMEWTDFERSLCGLALSLDAFHEPIPVENMVKLMARSYFNNDKMVRGKNWRMIDMGRAEGMQWHTLVERPEKAICHDFSDEIEEGNIEELYMNAKGSIVPHCDLSYEKQEEFKMADVTDENWLETLAENSHKIHSMEGV